MKLQSHVARIFRLKQLRAILNEAQTAKRTENETIALVEDQLRSWGLSYHTRRDYLVTLGLKD